MVNASGSASVVKGYTCWKLSEESRQAILEMFPPKYPEVVCEHVTDKFFVDHGEAILPANAVNIIAHVDSGDGIEALLVSVCAEKIGVEYYERTDTIRYHITLSFDPEAAVNDTISKAAESHGFFNNRKYTPVHSGFLLEEKNLSWYFEKPKLCVPVEPKFFSFETKEFEEANTKLLQCGAWFYVYETPDYEEGYYSEEEGPFRTAEGAEKALNAAMKKTNGVNGSVVFRRYCD